MTDPDVLERRKYWQYQTAGDSHVRETHMAMDGRVFPADSKVWDTWYPPNGFGCRCTVVSRTEEQVKRMGLQVENDMPKAVDLETLHQLLFRGELLVLVDALHNQFRDLIVYEIVRSRCVWHGVIDVPLNKNLDSSE